MKKMKFLIMTLAIVLSIGAAFASRRSLDCRTATQYYSVGSGYMPAGTEGVSYVCETGGATCTYYLVGLTYTPCQTGTWIPVPSLKPAAK
jgi:Family of unknown function (DUF6520)